MFEFRYYYLKLTQALISYSSLLLLSKQRILSSLATLFLLLSSAFVSRLQKNKNNIQDVMNFVQRLSKKNIKTPLRTQLERDLIICEFPKNSNFICSIFEPN